MSKEIMQMVTVCTIIEAIITYFNNFFVFGNPHYQMILSLALGVVVAVCYKLDLFKTLNIESNIPYVGSVLTGILFSRGSNYLYDLIKSLNLIN